VPAAARQLKCNSLNLFNSSSSGRANLETVKGFGQNVDKTLAIIGKPARETKAKQQPQRRLTLTVELDRVSWKRPSS